MAKLPVATFQNDHENATGSIKLTRTVEFSLDGRQIIMKGDVVEYMKDKEHATYKLPDTRLSDPTQLRNLYNMLFELLNSGVASSGDKI